MFVDDVLKAMMFMLPAVVLLSLMPAVMDSIKSGTFPLEIKQATTTTTTTFWFDVKEDEACEDIRMKLINESLGSLQRWQLENDLIRLGCLAS